MSSNSDFAQLADILIRAHELSGHTKSKQLRAIIELAMYELGTLIAEQSQRERSNPDASLD
jgi:hypothetical protein